MIVLVDYGAGNLTSVRKALAAVGADVRVAQTPDVLVGADGLIVPGVGHFGATASLNDAWRAKVRALVEAGRPVFGICLGMQWLFEASDEAPGLAGLGLMPGTCRRLGDRAGGGAADTGEPLKVPHVGWNTLRVTRPGWLLGGVADGAHAYFTHSYAAPTTPDTAAMTTYGAPFASVVERNEVAGVQFHPEKSAEVGLQILRNFVARCM